MDSPARIEVDGEVFEVAPRRDRPGQHDYTWISGPNPGYGFSSSGGLVPTMADHEEAIRTFLAQIDPETGYIG